MSNVANAVGNISSNIAGFKVLVTSYLFRLDWNEDTSNNFYINLWNDKSSPNVERQEKWRESMSDFKLKYIGCTTVFSGKTSLGGVEKEKDMFLKVCTRAIDKSISNLQKSFDEFKVFTPLISTDPICAYIGLKEGVDIDSRFEVLEKVIDENGRTKYERVGMIKPVEGQIWDNRFMAIYDKEDGSELKYTTFEKVSGKDFYSGMLIREIGAN